MPRALRHTLFALALLLAAGLVVAAGRSFVAYDRVERDRPTDLGGPWRRDWLRLDSNAGRLDLSVLRETRTSRPQYDDLRAHAAPFRYYQRPGRHTMPTANPWLRLLGLFAQFESRPDHLFVRVILPYWLPILLLLTWPLARLYRRARPRRPAAGIARRAGTTFVPPQPAAPSAARRSPSPSGRPAALKCHRRRGAPARNQ